MKNIITFVALSLFICASVNGQSKKEKKAAKALEEYVEMKALIETKEYDFQADWATTVPGGRRINLASNPNFLKIDKDSANIYLPFFGTSTTGGGAMTNDGGITIFDVMENYEMEFDDKKQKITVKFAANKKNERYLFQLIIFRSGNTMINVNSNYRSGIKYEGITKRPTSKN